MEMTKGANAPIDGDVLQLSWQNAPGGGELDASAYLLTDQGIVEGDEGMVFYGQPSTQGITLSLQGLQARYSLQLGSLPANITRIAVCLVIDSSKDASARLSQAGVVTLTMGQLVYREDVSQMSEQALIVGEIYKRADQWKLRAVGQGFNGGLAALSTHFGVTIAAEQPAAPPPPPAAPVSLTKVTLAKSEKVSLKKGGGEIKATLMWEGRGGGDGDLDFYCFYVTKDGRPGKVYWKDLGSATSSPFIRHSGDSQRAGEEEIVIARPEELRFAMFAAYSAVGNGTGSFESFRPKVVLKDHAGNEVTIPLLNPNHTSYWVAITHISFGAAIEIEHIETYGKSGLLNAWAAEKAPRLHADGSWDISKGEVEFKD